MFEDGHPVEDHHAQTGREFSAIVGERFRAARSSWIWCRGSNADAAVGRLWGRPGLRAARPAPDKVAITEVFLPLA